MGTSMSALARIRTDHTAVLYINQMGSGSGHHTKGNAMLIAGSS